MESEIKSLTTVTFTFTDEEAREIDEWMNSAQRWALKDEAAATGTFENPLVSEFGATLRQTVGRARR